MAEHPNARRIFRVGRTRGVPLKAYHLQCAWCGSHVTLVYYPGQLPRVCSPACSAAARTARACVRTLLGQIRPACPDPGQRRRRPHASPRLRISAAPRAAQRAWCWQTWDLPLLPHAAADAAVQACTTLRAHQEALGRMREIFTTTAFNVLDDVAAALLVWRPAVVRQALLQALIQVHGTPANVHPAATVVSALAIAYDPAWPTAIQELQVLVQCEHDLRPLTEYLSGRLRRLVTTILDALHTAQVSSERAWDQLMAWHPPVWPVAVLWLTDGVNALMARSADPPVTSVRISPRGHLVLTAEQTAAASQARWRPRHHGRTMPDRPAIPAEVPVGLQLTPETVLTARVIEHLLDTLLPAANKSPREHEDIDELHEDLAVCGIETCAQLASLIHRHRRAVVQREHASVCYEHQQRAAGMPNLGLPFARILAGVVSTHTGLVRSALQQEYGKLWNDYMHPEWMVKKGAIRRLKERVERENEEPNPD